LGSSLSQATEELGLEYEVLKSTLKAERTSRIVYPSSPEVLRAFELTQLKDLKAVIIGQDPYHNGAATGLAFGVREGFKINPSLRVIYKELCLEHGEEELPNFDFSLESWAKQGVLLLNTPLTVVKGHPNSPAAEVYGSMKAGFVGSNCFMKANDYLSQPINWI